MVGHILLNRVPFSRNGIAVDGRAVATISGNGSFGALSDEAPIVAGTYLGVVKFTASDGSGVFSAPESQIVLTPEPGVGTRLIAGIGLVIRKRRASGLTPTS
jgi:hypothetical protein